MQISREKIAKYPPHTDVADKRDTENININYILWLLNVPLSVKQRCPTFWAGS